MKDALKAARRCGVPLISIVTSDQRATILAVIEAINGNSPVISYDCESGLQGLNDPGRIVYAQILGDADPALLSDPVTALSACRMKAPEKTVIILIGADRLIPDARIQQAIVNCRDPFKSTMRVIIMLSPTRLTLPADLQEDTLQLEDLPPDEEGRTTIIKELFKDAELKEPEATVIKTAVNATRGLSSYAAEQAVALSMSKKGLDTDSLWLRWRQAINATPGLTVDTSGSTLNDIGGLDNFKDFSRKIMKAKNPPSAIIRIEEIEKIFAGAGYGSGMGDSSGTSQGILQYMLTFMQEENATGLIALGPAGGGKSLSSVAMGSAGDVPTITLDLGAVKGSLVGESEKNMRKALSTIKALAGSKTFWIGTCNSLVSLPPELRRRFQYGIWFFDLPSAQERDAIWKIWLKKYPEVKDVRPADEGWTGAEIRTAVQTADDLGCTPKEAAQWIVPVCKMSAEVIEGLRKQASNRYLSANYAGPYQYSVGPTQAVSTGRKMNLN
jgi:hypothetical protein